MTYRDPERQRAAMAAIQRERSRAAPLYRAAILAAASGEPALWQRFEAMMEAELAWRDEQGLTLPRWPTTHERALCGAPELE